METEYRVDRGGKRVIMSYRVFKSLDFHEVCKLLGIKDHATYEPRKATDG
jgi:hypothetical protein